MKEQTHLLGGWSPSQLYERADERMNQRSAECCCILVNCVALWDETAGAAW